MGLRPSRETRAFRATTLGKGSRLAGFAGAEPFALLARKRSPRYGWVARKAQSCAKAASGVLGAPAPDSATKSARAAGS